MRSFAQEIQHAFQDGSLRLGGKDGSFREVVDRRATEAGIQLDWNGIAQELTRNTVRVLNGEFSGIAALIERVAQPAARERELQERKRPGPARSLGGDDRS